MQLNQPALHLMLLDCWQMLIKQLKTCKQAVRYLLITLACTLSLLCNLLLSTCIKISVLMSPAQHQYYSSIIIEYTYKTCCVTKCLLWIYSSCSRCSNLISITSALTAFIHQLALADLFCYCPTLHLFHERYVSGDPWSLGCVFTGGSVVRGLRFLGTLQLLLSLFLFCWCWKAGHNLLGSFWPH